MGVRFATDLKNDQAVPYFLWDEPMTLGDLRRRLATAGPEERIRLSSKVMREARFAEVVALIPMERMVEDYPLLRRNLGRRRAFWDFLFNEWRRLGLLS